MAKLIFSDDKFHGRVYELILAKTTVGRGDHNTLVIHNDSVSHTHCEILVYGQEIIVRDLGSRNGTSVRGVRLRNQQRPLHHGDVVKFGEVEARLELDESSDTDAAEDFTAVHEYAQLLREREAGKTKPPADASLKLGDAPEDTGADHTVMMPVSRQAASGNMTDPTPSPPTPSKPSPQTPRALLIAVLLLASVVVLWLLFR